MAKDEKFKEKNNIKTGFFEDGLPYARMGNKPSILVCIEALSFKHEPLSGFMLKRFFKSLRNILEEYTVFYAGRKPNLPIDYYFNNMADDYAKMIRREFKGPVDVMGISTGGQLAHYLAADHPDVVRKLVIMSAAYRLSEKGAEIEGRAAEYFKQGKYGKSMATIIEMIYSSGIKRSFIKFFIRLFGKMMFGKMKYPNDGLVEFQADLKMNFKDRLKNIKAPTLVLSGDLDICYSAEDVRITAEKIPNAKLILYKGYGHNLTAKEVPKDILSFLKK